MGIREKAVFYRAKGYQERIINNTIYNNYWIS